eukprot:CAMPEP_0167744462 /NCGR_PEP_ID=MMETSP0110_2-20121227/2606_1 /TAXON_ID=629695 /ORGANISM="Gymnochlora sp., Strain CCMP2014" /LENGTH=309 /DNA_ID=CAMNT_0007628989 /DNA_START=64 /DNA_END=990 /DNA_ORIENTATION=+
MRASAVYGCLRRGGLRGRFFSTKVSICLDWTPNTNHSGIYAAQALGMFEKQGLDVEIVQPGPTDDLTPGRKVARGLATFAISSSESAVSFATSDGKNRLVAVAALLQGSTSSICTLADSGIGRPADLAGKRYASYDGRFEDAIVQQMVLNDGGSGEVNFHSLDFHGYADETTMNKGSVVSSYLSDGRSDSTWIFSHWEAIRAKRDGTKLNLFHLEDYGIPYGYSPVILASETTLNKSPETAKAFLRALDESHKYCASNTKSAAEILMNESKHPSCEDIDMLVESQESLGDKYLEKGRWGKMELERWESW